MMVPMLATSRDSARRARSVRSLALLITVAALWLTTGSGCDDDPAEPDGSDVDAVALELALGKGSEGLTPEVSDGFQNDVADTLSGYVGSAFLGDYPRTDFVRTVTDNLLSRFAGGPVGVGHPAHDNVGRFDLPLVNSVSAS